MAKVLRTSDHSEVAIVLTDAQYKILRSMLWTAQNTMKTSYSVLDELELNFKYFGLLRSDLDLTIKYAEEMTQDLINELH